MITLHETVMEAGAAKLAMHSTWLRTGAGTGRVNLSVGPVGTF